jgi:hypothetical protein
MMHYIHVVKSGPSGTFLEIFCTGKYFDYYKDKSRPSYTSNPKYTTCKDCLEKLSILDILE